MKRTSLPCRFLFSIATRTPSPLLYRTEIPFCLLAEKHSSFNHPAKNPSFLPSRCPQWPFPQNKLLFCPFPQSLLPRSLRKGDTFSKDNIFLLLRGCFDSLPEFPVFRPLAGTSGRLFPSLCSACGQRAPKVIWSELLPEFFGGHLTSFEGFLCPVGLHVSVPVTYRF